MLVAGSVGSGGLGSDTWKWDGKSWRLLPTKSPVEMTAGASLAYSAPLRKVIQFGGSHFRTAPGDDQIWVWDGEGWSLVTYDPSPPGRSEAAMASDPNGRVILLFGGIPGITKQELRTKYDLLSDTWMFTGAWAQDTQTPAPPPRFGSMLAPESSGDSFVLFGGIADATYPPKHWLSDTWVWGE
jgi:hypothetical protein